MTTSLRSVTVGIRDLDKALELFNGYMGLDIDESGIVPDDVLNAWGLPGTASARYTLLSRNGYVAGKIRLIQTNSVAQTVVRSDLLVSGSDSPFDIGPKALDVYIPASIDEAVSALEAMGYPLINGPVDYGPVEALHAGPDGVPLMLMVRPSGPSDDIRADLPVGTTSEVATISVISASPENSARFYGDLLQIPNPLDQEAPPRFADAVSRLTSVPVGTRVYLQTYVEENQASGKMLLVHYPDGDGKRLEGRMKPGQIGICLYSFERSDLGGFDRRARTLGFAVEQAPVETTWGRIALVRGPNEELIEITEV